MDKKTLASLTLRGGITAIFSASKKSDLDFAKELASSLSGERPFLIFDFSNTHEFHTSSKESFSLASFFNPFDLKTQKALEQTASESAVISTDNSFSLIKIDDNSIRIFLKNIVFLQKLFPEIIFLCPIENAKKIEALMRSARTFVCDVKDANAADIFALNFTDFDSFDAFKIWYGNTPIPSSLKYIFKELPQNVEKNVKANTLASIILDFRQIRILHKNAPEGILYKLSKLWPLFAILFLLIPLCIPLSVFSVHSRLRDMRYDRNSISEAPYIEYEFDGKESLRRIARYAIGRFHAQVTTPTIVTNYIAETLEKNNFYEDLVKSGDDYILAPATKLKFYPADSIESAPDSIESAWRYFTGMLSDTIAYITELYHKDKTDENRKHNGIDLASRRGARILAPFAAKAWTFNDERGGTVIGLVQKEAVILFMHCDQLLYLNGQTVMAGDPIATIGVTGHTTGPHAHIVTGIVSSRGDKILGGIRYKVIDPVEWYSRFK